MTDNRAVQESPRRFGPQGTVPAPLFFVVGAIAQYLGAALAVRLFDQLSPAGVAWLRVGFAAAVLWLWRRPQWRRWPAQRRLAVAAFGMVLAAMNLCFYLAVQRLPLGTAVAIEFSGPIVVAAFGTRTTRSVASLALAVLGVLLLADVQWSASPSGVALALGAAALWAGYILLAAAVAGRPAGEVGGADAVGAAGAQGGADGAGLDGLACSLVVGSAFIGPPGIAALWFSRPSLAVIVGCALVGLLSNVIPYGLDVIVLPRLSAAQFALLLSLLPATATVVGVVVLRQIPTGIELVGLAAVVSAVILRPAEQPA